MTVPGRLHITWQDADTLRIDTDAGKQTRLFRFTARAAGDKSGDRPTWQGESAARWERVAAPDKGGSLRVVTSNMRAGYLRKNGVPYSERATVSEHFDIAPASRWRRAAPRHHHRRGSCVPERAVCREPALQEGA